MAFRAHGGPRYRRPDPGAGGGGPEPSAEQVRMLADVGFSRVQALKARRGTVRAPHTPPGREEKPLPASSSGGTAAVVAGALSLAHVRFVSYEVLSVHSGHYVMHILTEAGWILFNDEKVVLTLKALTCLYVFERDPIVG
ncbi:hypothetical protein H4582DRAFT_2077849 [Lactarius indigo]|nr:hypothetical protein H4582DRAFT_2077849 [Lactarius indigo]